MNRIMKTGTAAAALALAMIAGAVPARAAARFDFLFSMDSVRNDRQYFLNLAVDKYGYHRRELEPLLPRPHYVEVDLPVVLFLSRESHRSVEDIVRLRSRGYAWSTVFARIGVPIDALFDDIDRDPGPPYGNAWGHWKRSRRDLRLSDNDVCRLAELQVGSRLTGDDPYELARGRRGNVVTYVAEKKGRRYREQEHRYDRDRVDDRNRDRGRDGDRHRHDHDDDGY